MAQKRRIWDERADKIPWRARDSKDTRGDGRNFRRSTRVACLPSLARTHLLRPVSHLLRKLGTKRSLRLGGSLICVH